MHKALRVHKLKHFVVSLSAVTITTLSRGRIREITVQKSSYLCIMGVLVLCTVFIFSMTIHQYRGPFSAQAYEYIGSTCNTSGDNYSKTSAYRTNLQHLLTDLVKQPSGTSLFYNTTYGTGDNQVYVIFYCRFDIKPEVCHQCIQEAAIKILQDCSVEKTAVIWYNLCTLRFASYSMYSLLEEPLFNNFSLHFVSNTTQFIHVMNDEMLQLIRNATSDNSGHAYGKRKVTDSQEVYCFVQCRPDIIGNYCDKCLRGCLKSVQTRCAKGNKGCIELSSSCMIKYDSSPFLEVAPMEPVLSPSNSSSSGKNATNHYIIRAAIPAVAALGFLLIGLCYYFLHRRQIQISKQPSKRTPKEPNQVQTHDLQSYEIKKIEIATNNFSISNILGEGGFGVVYRGMLENGKQVAIKRLSKGLSQGIIEFKTEVEVVARLQQRNLVQLLGFCIEGEERMLVYQFLVNLSLDKFLFDRSRSSLLTWPIRNNIIYGMARGLHYLHEDSRLTIIHRDLKTSNILLDEQFDPKIGDFGIARLVNCDETAGYTTKLVGTMGYMAPEYTNSGRFSVKSDVYSLGIIILEILSGLKVVKYYHPIHGEGLLGTALRVWSEGSIGELVDPILGNNYSTIEAKRCLHIGLLCVQDNPARRPTMRAVLHMLNSNSGEFPFPLIPSHGVTTYEINTSASVTMSDDKDHHTDQSISGDTGSLDTLSMYYR